MIATLIHSTLYYLGSDFKQITWPSYAGTCWLNISGSLRIAISSLTNRQERLKFHLGSKEIVTINDGSIIVQYARRDAGRTATWGINVGGRVVRPVVSIEVSFFVVEC